MGGRGRPERDGGYEPQYDILLTAIPAVFVTSYLLVAGHVAEWPTALAVASLASGLVVAAALFFDPPIDATN